MKLLGVSIFILLYCLTGFNVRIFGVQNSLASNVSFNDSKFATPHAQLCGDTAKCNRALCNDTKHLPPVECMEHVDEMECFRVCKDPQIFLDCLKEHPKGAAYCAIIFQRHILTTGNVGTKSPHIALPCEIKCRTDPLFWSCIHKCDDRGCYSAFKNCETLPRNETDPRPWCDVENDPDYLTRIECRDCYIHNVTTELADSPECTVRYSFSGAAKSDNDQDSANATTTQNQTLAVNATNDGPEKKSMGFGDVQPKCIYYADIKDGKRPEFNETLPFQIVKECLKRKGILFPDDYDYNRTGGLITPAPGSTLSPNISRTTPFPIYNPALISREYIEECFGLELGSRQIYWCTGNGYYMPCEKNARSLECQQHCLTHLTNPYCYIPCPRNDIIQDCEDECSRKYPEIDCECTNTPNGLREQQRTKFFLDITARLEGFKQRTANCKNQSCFYHELHDAKPTPYDPAVQAPPVDEWEEHTSRRRNCLSYRHTRLFADRLAKLKGFPSAFADGMEELPDYYNLAECKRTECNATFENDAAHCALRCIKIRRIKETELICDDSPSSASVFGRRKKRQTNPASNPLKNYLRTEITLWCLLREFGGDTPWTLERYMEIPSEFEDYKKLVECEENASNLSKNFLPAEEYHLFAQILYEIEKEWCEGCLKTSEYDPHDYKLDHVNCEIQFCYVVRQKDTCRPLKNTKTMVQLVSSTDCSWQIDYSLSREPTRLWANYFDEISPHDETNTLQKPNTLSYLMKSVVTFGKGHYVFPYFVVIRPICDDGYYDDEIYKFIASGAAPNVRIYYTPSSSRAKHVDLLYASFQGALMNLQRISDVEKRYIPPNPRNRKVGNESEYDGTSGCHLGVCYPAFAVPQVLLHIPSVHVVVNDQQVFSSKTHIAYVATMHVRDVPGAGMLKIENKTDRPTADVFFPKRKAQVYEDVQIVDLWARLPDSGYAGEDDNRPGPEIEYQTDHNCEDIHRPEPMEIGGNIHAPLDTEDFFRMQYAHGSAPQVVIAGFYDPNLVIIGDPDMKTFELARWGFEATGGTISKPTPRLFQGYYKCFSHHYPLGGYIKPMYSGYDRLDPFYWLQFYRMRYLPKNYSDTSAVKAVFEAFALEDRILLLTSSGLVSFYQNYNQTALLGKPWEVEGRDRLEMCFKIVRIARRSHPITDTIVAITYDYQIQSEDENNNETRDISQKVFIGRYVGAGKPIEWEEIKGGLSTQNLKEERVYNVGADKLGDTEALPPKKLIDIPVERRETAPRSQIEAICYIVYRNKMGKAEYIELIEDQGWCEAIDATPVVAVESKIQVLVRMRAYYSGGTGGGAGGTNVKRVAFFYVVASINTDKAASLYSIWQIDAIIPRIPCLDEHTQSIPNVVQFDMEYFRKGDPRTVGLKYGCHEIPENKRVENHIFLHGITYTRNFNLHMFLYGNKLLQSTDGGQTFVHLKSFPATEDPVYREKCMGAGGNPSSKEASQLAYHRIKLMTFDDVGHYAFLTSKRELWYGNLGSLEQIRLRPSPAYSMILTTLYEVREINEAVPFAVFFDSNDKLVEMVAVVDANGTVSRIARREVDERVILRARHFIDLFQKESEQRYQKLKEKVDIILGGNSVLSPVLESELTDEFRYDPIKWSVFCPFASPYYYHNFSEAHARAQYFFFPRPRQHPGLGIISTKSALMTYQAVTFSLVWNSYFSDLYRAYSYLHEDPFITWKKNKVDAAVIGRLRYLNMDPNEHGVLVLPDKYRRILHSPQDAHRIFSIYYMDYNYIVKILIEYSISNDFTLTPIDYVRHSLSAIQLNVDNSNGTLIQVNTEKEVIAAKAAVRYTIHMSIKKNTGLPQQYSGRNALIVPIYFHLIGGFGKCITTASSGILGDSIATSIAVGCPPSTTLVFDWNTTVYSIKFRNVSAHFGDDSNECYQGESFCFFVRYPLTFHFHTFDDAKQIHNKFTGKYIMRIIGGGYSREEMKDYTVEEQQAFNVPGVSDVSLIWNEWDNKQHQKKEHKQDLFKAGRNDSREIVLQAGVSSIKWACHTLSPCARIHPRSNFESIYYFKIFVTNRGVDNDTLCLFEKEFIILLYGFPPSPELQLITTIAFYIFVLLLLYIVYLFFRNKKKLWKSSLLKLQGWLQIVKDTFPKTWESSGDDLVETEEERRKRHDEIIMSLQGHLNVPRLIQKHTRVTGPSQPQSEAGLKSRESEFSIQDQEVSSASSYKSGSSGGSQTPLLNPVAGRAGAATWTDMIYEQIISKRLAAIVEKNRREQEELKKKAMRGEIVKDHH